MKNVTIHVGLHKTATTFLQTSVFPNVANTTFVTRPYTQLNHAFNQLQYADDSLYDETAFRDALQEINADNLILSDESFSGKPIFFSYVNRSFIARRLASVFPDANIILFIRDQRDIMISHYSSYIKMPYGTAFITDLFRKPDGDYSYRDYTDASVADNHNTIYYNTNDYHVSLDCFKYSPTVKLYQELFNNVHVFTYENLRHDMDATVARLSNIVGQPIDHQSTKRENKSLSGSMLAKRRVLNNILSPRSSKYVRRGLASLLSVMPPMPSRNLQDVMDDHIGDYYVEDNKLLKSLLPELNWDQYPNKYR